MERTRNPEKTKQVILDSAAAKIHRQGYKAASVSDILDETGLTRGALYHHFPNKHALGLAVVEHIGRMVDEMWLAPLEGTDDPVAGLQQAMMLAGQSMKADDLLLGCPLNNLAQELSPLDEEFRGRIMAIYRKWQDGFAQAFKRGQEAGKVRADLNPEAAATFIVAALTGGRGLAKTARDTQPLADCVQQLFLYLDTLRP